MKTIRLLFLLLLSGMLLASTAARAAPAQSPNERLVGIWQEYEPSSNVVQFFPDHTVRIYLTEEEGSDSDTHWIGGTWSISPASVLVMKLSANGNTMEKQLKVVFDGQEMVLVDDSDGETRHRRLTGDIPEKYQW